MELVNQKKYFVFLLLVFIFICSSMSSPIINVCEAKETKVEENAWASKETFTLFVSPEVNKNSFIRATANKYHSWSKNLQVSSSFVVRVLWQIPDWIISGVLWFIVALSDLFTLRLMGIIGSVIDEVCYRLISTFAIFGIYI